MNSSISLIHCARSLSRANAVVGEHAECCFPADFLEASGEIGRRLSFA